MSSPPSPAPGERALASDAVLLVVDAQGPLSGSTLDADELGSATAILVRVARLFGLPFLLTAVPGAGPLLPGLQRVQEDAPVLLRTTPDAFGDARVRAELAQLTRRTLIVAGAATEVAVQLTALTAGRLGWRVLVPFDACAGLGARSESAAHARLVQAGVEPTSIATFVAELAGDFASERGREALGYLLRRASNG